MVLIINVYFKLIIGLTRFNSLNFTISEEKGQKFNGLKQAPFPQIECLVNLIIGNPQETKIN